MSESRSNEILEAWRSVASAAALPADAPRPTRTVLRMSIAGPAVAAIVVLVALLMRGAASPRVPIGAASSSSPSASTSATVPAVTPSPTAVPPPIPLPNPGGTCSASQIVVGTPTYSNGYGTIGSTSVFVTLLLRNAGADCVLQLPAVIGMAATTGPFEAVNVLDAGTESAAGDNSPKQSATIRAGRSLTIVFGASWPIGSTFPGPCRNPMSDVTRLEFPLARGTIEIELPTRFNQVCSSPASMSLTIKGG